LYRSLARLTRDRWAGDQWLWPARSARS